MEHRTGNSVLPEPVFAQTARPAKVQSPWQPLPDRKPNTETKVSPLLTPQRQFLTLNPMKGFVFAPMTLSQTVRR